MSRRPSTTNYKKLSRRMRTSNVGNISTASAHGARRGSNARYARPSARGEIRQVLTQPTARDTLASYDPRRKRSYVERNVAASRRRNVALVIALAAVVVALACVVGMFVYLGSIDGKLALSDNTVASALSADSGEENTTYTLLTADFDGDDTAPDAFVVLRNNTQANNAYAISIPANLQVEVDGQQTTLGALRASSGDGAIVSAVNNLLGVKISHYATLNSAGFVSLVDALGGVEVTLDQDISDAQAGSMSLQAGTQVLTGEQALFVCRANDFVKDPESTRGANIAKVACALLQKAQTLPSGLGFFTTVDSLAEYASCDMGVRAAGSLLDALRTVPAENMYAAALPLEYTYDGEPLQAASADVAIMMDQIRAGGSPIVENNATVDAAAAADITVTVNNGGDVVGAALEAADMLKGLGFDVTSTGNTSMQVYDETLVIYSDESSATAAQAIVDALGVGRTLLDTVHYSYDTDIYVVVGKDWRAVLATTGRTVDDEGNIVTVEEAAALAKAKEEAAKAAEEAAKAAEAEAQAAASAETSSQEASASNASASTNL